MEDVPGANVAVADSDVDGVEDRVDVGRLLVLGAPVALLHDELRDDGEAVLVEDRKPAHVCCEVVVQAPVSL